MNYKNSSFFLNSFNYQIEDKANDINEKTDDKEEIYNYSNISDTNQIYSSYSQPLQMDKQKESDEKILLVDKKYQSFIDFFGQFYSDTNNSVTKTDLQWKEILIKMFDIQDEYFPINSQIDINDNFTIKLNTKKMKKIERMKKALGNNHFDIIDVLKIKNPKLPKSFKKCVINGIPDSLRSIIWKTIIDPLNTDFEILQQEIIDRITLENDIFNENDDNNKKCDNSISNFISDYSQQYISSSSEDVQFQSSNYSYDNYINSNLIKYLSNNADQNVVDDINKDINRTLIQFEEVQNESFKNSLKNILSAYSVVDKDLGYTQGMAFLAGLLLLYMDEYSAFSSFSILMLSPKFKLRELFIRDFPRISLMNKIWQIALEKYFPTIFKKLKKENVDPILYTVGWWMTAFSCFSFNKDVLLFIFDRYLLYGSSSLISFGLTIVSSCKKFLIKSPIDDILSLLQNPTNISKLNDLSYVHNQMIKKYYISKSKFNQMLKKAKITCLY